MPSAEDQKLIDFISKCQVSVEKTLDELVPAKDVEPRRLHRAVRWSLFAGGKRFRPALLLAVGNIFEADPKNLLKTAAAIEMVHTYSLIHDDLPAMDDDDLRRGRATCHKKFDEATAILAGDVLQTLAFQAVAGDKKLSAETKVRLVSEISRAIGTPAGMVAGQMLDLEAERKPIGADHLENIHAAKTGALINAAVRCGAVIAGAKESEIRILSEYALRLGQLFQVTDDLLDVTASAKAIGKTPGKDAKAKKATYVSLYGLERAGKIAEKLHTEAGKKLYNLNRDTSLLRNIADYVLHRKK
jgi:geranylgeranyl diphosphate synthase type II